MSAKGEYRIIGNDSYSDGTPMYELQRWVPGVFWGGSWRYAHQIGRLEDMKKALARKVNPHIIYAADIDAE